MTVTLTTKMKSLVMILVLANLSEQKSIRRQLEFLPSTFPSAPTDDTSEKPATRLPKAGHSGHTSGNDDQQESPISEDEALPPLLEMSAINQLLEFLTRNATSLDFDSEAGAGGGSSQGRGSSGADALTTGNLKIDKLLANLEEPSERSKSIWMALLQDLVSNGSLTELLGNFIQESASQAKREDPSFPGLEGQEDLLEEQQQQSPDQPGAPGSPLTQMEEFILEPHLGPAIMPFQLPEGFFVSFIPRRAFGVVNGVARPPHGHGSFYNYRPPGLVDVINAPAYGYHFHGYRRFDPEAGPFDESYFYDDEDEEFAVGEEGEGAVDE